MKLLTRKWHADYACDSLLWWASAPRHWWAVGVCLPFVHVYWCWEFRYHCGADWGWTVKTRTQPRG